MSKIGVVVIGRNEGDRLIRSLDSAIDSTRMVVYVDSGSTDQSCAAALDRGVEVVELDMTVPFTAARARNAGFARLRDRCPDAEYVQFIDGDCELVAGWIEAAIETLAANSRAVAVCGWRRERHPDRSLYNRICDVEWRMGDVGETLSFAGDVMLRVEAFAAVGGYDDRVIAGEEGELCVRLRRNQGKIFRIDQNCTLHDADMHQFSQWWNRAKRCGYAYAMGSSMHGNSPERKDVKAVRRSLLWGLAMPLAAVALAIPTDGLALILLGRYPLAALKTFYSTNRRGFAPNESLAWGLSCGLAAFPEAIGATKFYLTRWQNKQHEIIEYKRGAAARQPSSK